MDASIKLEPRYGAQRLTVELTNSCNLHCPYCLRDEDALYHHRAEFIPVELVRSILRQARDVAGITEVGFTGGEPTLHPHFAELIGACGSVGIKASFVTNGWHFQKLWPKLLTHRDTLSHISFSLDGASREAHDYWRGEGSFVRLIQAVSHCYKAGLPFTLKVGIRRDTIQHLEKIALLGARLGAAGVSFSHIMPTSKGFESESSLNTEERKRAEEEIALLARIFKMKLGIDVGYYNLDPSAPCSPLAGASFNIDYKGNLTLCCNLSGFRGAVGRQDIVANLRTEDFSSAYPRLRTLQNLQLERRKAALKASTTANQERDLYIGSPCLFCLRSFGKVPWRAAAAATVEVKRYLPVVLV